MDFFNSKLNKEELVDVLSKLEFDRGVDSLEIISLRKDWKQLGRAALVRLIEEKTFSKV